MPELQGPMTNGVPIVRVKIRQRKNGSCLESPALRVALDNGANELFLKSGTLSGLGFEQSNCGYVQTGSSGNSQLVGFNVEMAVVLPWDPPTWFPMTVGEIENIPFQQCEDALGWPFLQKCVFILDGPKSIFTLTW
jgi:hypothetical protein